MGRNVLPCLLPLIHQKCARAGFVGLAHFRYCAEIAYNRSCSGFDAHLHSECFQAADQASFHGVAVVLIEVVGTEVTLGLMPGEHMHTSPEDMGVSRSFDDAVSLNVKRGDIDRCRPAIAVLR
jgi:hypothetical protein